MDRVFALVDCENVYVSFVRDWTMKRERRSPHYTTRWTDLPTARA